MTTYDLTQTTPSSIVTGDILNCPYSGTYKTITLPAGTYKLECWGAQGGNNIDGVSGNVGGKGGYASGELTLQEPTLLYLVAGGKGKSNTSACGGYNGGANWRGGSGPYGAGGGGGSDIRIGLNSYYSRVIVAGGGGGGCNYQGNRGNGGYGGGGSGGIGGFTTSNYPHGLGGTQTAGGSYTSGSQGSYKCSAGTFGEGGNGAGYPSYGGAGGGGWYGGGGGCVSAGGGGSGYIHRSTSSRPSGYTLTSDFYLSNGQLIAGNASMPSTSGSTETGHSGDGYVRITVISAVSSGLSFKVKQSDEWEEVSKGYAKISGSWKEINKVFYKSNGQWIET